MFSEADDFLVAARGGTDANDYSPDRSCADAEGGKCGRASDGEKERAMAWPASPAVQDGPGSRESCGPGAQAGGTRPQRVDSGNRLQFQFQVAPRAAQRPGARDGRRRGQV